MNAFKYSKNEEAAPAMKTPVVAIVALSNEHNRLENLCQVLDAHNLTLNNYSRLVV